MKYCISKIYIIVHFHNLHEWGYQKMPLIVSIDAERAAEKL